MSKVLKKNSIDHETMPAPRKLSVDCGVSISFDHDDFDALLKKLNKTNIHRIYKVENEEYDMIFEN